MHIVTQLQKAY